MQVVMRRTRTLSGVTYRSNVRYDVTPEIGSQLVSAGWATSFFPAFNDQAEQFISLTDFGAACDGVTDDTEALQAAIATAESVRGVLLLPPGKTVRITSGITIRSSLLSINGGGCVLDASSLTSGYALSIVTNESAPFSQQTKARPIENLVLIGSSSESNNTDGVFIGRTGAAGEVSGQTFRNVLITGFRDGVFVGNQAYINDFYNVNVEDCWRYGVHYVGLINTGESWNWFGGRIANCTHSGASAIGLFMPTGGNNDIYFHGTSIDYCDTLINAGSGTIKFFGGNIENNTTTPMIVLSNGVGDFTQFICAGKIAPTEGTPRARLIECVSGDQVHVNLNGAMLILGTGWDGEIVSVTGGFPKINFDGAFANITGTSGLTAKWSNAYNALYNGDAEIAGTAPWFTTGTVTLTNNPGSGVGSSASLRMVAAGTTFTVVQRIACKPGQIVYGEAQVNVTARTGGTFFWRIRFFDESGAQLVQSVDIASWSAVTSGYERRSTQRRVPAGAVWCHFDFNGQSWNGTADADQCRAWVL